MDNSNPVLDALEEVEQTFTHEAFNKLAKLLRSGQERRASLDPSALFLELAASSAPEFDAEWTHCYQVIYMGKVAPEVVANAGDCALAEELLDAAYPDTPAPQGCAIKRMALALAKRRVGKVE